MKERSTRCCHERTCTLTSSRQISVSSVSASANGYCCKTGRVRHAQVSAQVTHIRIRGIILVCGAERNLMPFVCSTIAEKLQRRAQAILPHLDVTYHFLLRHDVVQCRCATHRTKGLLLTYLRRLAALSAVLAAADSRARALFYAQCTSMCLLGSLNALEPMQRVATIGSAGQLRSTTGRLTPRHHYNLANRATSAVGQSGGAISVLIGLESRLSRCSSCTAPPRSCTKPCLEAQTANVRPSRLRATIATWQEMSKAPSLHQMRKALLDRRRTQRNHQRSSSYGRRLDSTPKH